MKRFGEVHVPSLMKRTLHDLEVLEEVEQSLQQLNEVLLFDRLPLLMDFVGLDNRLKCIKKVQESVFIVLGLEEPIEVDDHFVSMVQVDGANGNNDSERMQEARSKTTKRTLTNVAKHSARLALGLRAREIHRVDLCCVGNGIFRLVIHGRNHFSHPIETRWIRFPNLFLDLTDEFEFEMLSQAQVVAKHGYKNELFPDTGHLFFRFDPHVCELVVVKNSEMRNPATVLRDPRDLGLLDELRVHSNDGDSLPLLVDMFDSHGNKRDISQLSKNVFGAFGLKKPQLVQEQFVSFLESNDTETDGSAKRVCTCERTMSVKKWLDAVKAGVRTGEIHRVDFCCITTNTCRVVTHGRNRLARKKPVQWTGFPDLFIVFDENSNFNFFTQNKLIPTLLSAENVSCCLCCPETENEFFVNRRAVGQMAITHPKEFGVLSTREKHKKKRKRKNSMNNS